MTFLKQADYIGYVMATLSKYVKINTSRLPQIPFYRGFFNNIKKDFELVGHIFLYIFLIEMFIL